MKTKQEIGEAHIKEMCKKVTWEQLKAGAAGLHCECIYDDDGDVCIREKIFDDMGVQQLQPRPDPCDFLSLELAAAKLPLIFTALLCFGALCGLKRFTEPAKCGLTVADHGCGWVRRFRIQFGMGRNKRRSIAHLLDSSGAVRRAG